ncbi:MAG: 30S ribosomal protein S12 methylthiotransferase RimO [Brevinemataceae bacterium]
MKIYFEALGCPKALVDAEKMCAVLFEDLDHEVVFDPEEADAVIVNTCGFIESAKQESINAILTHAQLKQNKPDLILAVSGCMVSRYHEELKKEIPEIDAFIGVKDPSKIKQIFSKIIDKPMLDEGEFKDTKQSNRSLLFSGFRHAWIKIAEGCDKKCAFCAIPLMRGTQRSRKESDILDEAKILLDQGIRELIVIAQDPVNYGIDLVHQRRLIPLLQQLETIGFDWIRVQYLFPDPMLLELADLFYQSSVFCNYIDVPLQHVSGNILQDMRRPGNLDSMVKLFEDMRRNNPDLAIRTSFIAGFPGETSDDADQVSQFLKIVKADRVGFFSYSREEGTESYVYSNQVDSHIAQDRIQHWADIQRQISTERLQRLVGQELICISEGISEDIDNQTCMIMRTQYDAPEIDGIVRVLVPKDTGIEFPGMAKVKITASDDHDLDAVLIEEV